MEYVIFDCANNEVYSHCLHSLTTCACAELEVPIHTCQKDGSAIWLKFQEGPHYLGGGILPHSPLSLVDQNLYLIHNVFYTVFFKPLI